MGNILYQGEILVAIVGGFISFLIAFVMLRSAVASMAKEIESNKRSIDKDLEENKRAIDKDLEENKRAIQHVNAKVGQAENRINSVELIMIKDMAELKTLFLERFADLKVQISTLANKSENKSEGD